MDWIRVEDEVPTAYETVWGLWDDDDVRMAYRAVDDTWYSHVSHGAVVFAPRCWMEVEPPDPPSEQRPECKHYCQDPDCYACNAQDKPADFEGIRRKWKLWDMGDDLTALQLRLTALEHKLLNHIHGWHWGNALGWTFPPKWEDE